MKADIHPGYGLIKATCSCGNIIETKSTLVGILSLKFAPHAPFLYW